MHYNIKPTKLKYLIAGLIEAVEAEETDVGRVGIVIGVGKMGHQDFYNFSNGRCFLTNRNIDTE